MAHVPAGTQTLTRDTLCRKYLFKTIPDPLHILATHVLPLITAFGKEKGKTNSGK